MQISSGSSHDSRVKDASSPKVVQPEIPVKVGSRRPDIIVDASAHIKSTEMRKCANQVADVIISHIGLSGHHKSTTSTTQPANKRRNATLIVVSTRRVESSRVVYVSRPQFNGHRQSCSIGDSTQLSCR